MLRVIGEDWQLKILSLLLAVGLWFFVASAERIEIALAVPIEYVGLEGPLTLNGPRRESVDVQLQATRWAAEHVSPGTVRVRVDVSGLREGDNLVHLLPDNVRTPIGVRVTRVTPAWTSVQAARAEVRTVQVVPQVQGHPAQVCGQARVDGKGTARRSPRRERSVSAHGGMVASPARGRDRSTGRWPAGRHPKGAWARFRD